MHRMTRFAVGSWRGPRATALAHSRGRLGWLPLLGLTLLLLAASLACGEDGATTEGDATGTPSTTGTATGTSEAAATATPAAAATFPQTATDDSGTTVELEAAPQRIVSLSPGSTEILFALGAGEQVVAVDRFSDYPEAAVALQQLEYSNPDPEATLAFDPDLVIMSTRQQEQVEQFRALGMNVLFLEAPADLEGVYDHIALLGRLTGRSDEAATVEAEMRERIDAVVAQVGDAEQGPRVFYEITADLYTAAPDTFIGALISLLGGQNIAAGASTPFPQLTAEAVIEADPEVILLSDAEFGESAETVAARPGWEGVSAVVNDRIYPIDPDIVDRPGPRLAEGIEAMARAMYPDRFE